MLMPKRLVEPLPEDVKVPDHVAMIPDGNRRWAREHKLPTFEGHRRGFLATPKLVRAARELGVHTLTIWAFSTENWNRSKEEIAYLMKMYEWFVGKHLAESKRDGARIYHLGRKDRIPKRLKEMLVRAEQETVKNEKHVMNIALDYGGQDEILRAIGKAKKGENLFEEIGKYQGKYPIYKLAEYLDTAGQPYPYVDLIIRTSGEQRTSGLYCWQGAYAELYFEKGHFPEFTPEKLRQAIIDYGRRGRRFGGN